MAKFLFIVPPFTGHINPTLSMGKQLAQRGHEVAWVSIIDSFKDQLPENAQLFLIERSSEGEGSDAYFEKIFKQGQSAFGIESVKFLYEGVLLPLSRFMYPGICEYIDSWKPDVVITDHQVYAGAVAAYQRGLPYVTSVTAPTSIKAMSEMPKILEWENEQIVSLQQELGLSGVDSIACSDQLTLVFTSEAFLGDIEFPESFQFVGPVILGRPATSSFNWDRFQNAPGRRVLVSIGTTFDMAQKKGFFERVIEALGGEPLNVVVVADEALFEHWPENFIVQSRVPQLELLPHLDAVVCHGGHNTVCESLSHGLPLVTIPIAYDQSHVAAQVVDAGCGVRLKFKRFKPGQLKDVVYEVLENATYSAAAANIKKSFEAAGGTLRAAQLLESLTLTTESL